MSAPEPLSSSPAALRALQEERLQVAVNRAYLRVEFYRARLDSLGLVPEDIRGIDDLRRLPFTTGDDLAAHYPYGLFAEPLRSIVRLKVAGSSRGRPVVVGFTKRDAATWQELVVRLFSGLSMTERDIVQVAFNFSLFPGAFTFNQAAEAIGATLAPSAIASATLQIRIMEDFRSTVLLTTPAFALHIAETFERESLSPESLHLRFVVLGPDPFTEAARERIEQVLGVPAYGLYGVTELVEPGLAGECPARDGFHLAEDHFLAEIVHPATGEPLPPGREGELVLTTLTAEGYPLIRFRTGDVTSLRTSPCACANSHARMAPVLRRTDGRVSVRGIPIHPSRVGEMLRGVDPHIADFRLVVTTRFGMGDDLEVLVTRPRDAPPPAAGAARLGESLRAALRRALGLGVRVSLVTPERLPMEGLGEKTVFIEASDDSAPLFSR